LASSSKLKATTKNIKLPIYRNYLNTIEQNNQILINREIAMGRKILLRAGQHKFESGEKLFLL